MAGRKQLEILKQGVEVWNKWRQDNPNLEINLRNADLSRLNLAFVNLSDADLTKANLTETNLSEANLSRANLREANLFQADLGRALLRNAELMAANLSRSRLNNADLSQAYLHDAHLFEASLNYANLTGAFLYSTNLNGANLEGADLSGSHLESATMVRTKVEKARISGSTLYGISVWDLDGQFDEQNDLIITPYDLPSITVDNIKVAQFIYLILNNKEIRDVINTLTSKSVLVLGRFSIPERKLILDALRSTLRKYNLLPIVFDFDRPADKDFTETIKTLAGLCYFVIADITNPKSSPLELQATVPDYQIPFVPIIQEGESPFAMMVDLQKKYNWVLNTVTYDSMETLIKVLKPLIIDPAMKKRQELRIIKAQEPEVISGKAYLDKGGK